MCQDSPSKRWSYHVAFPRFNFSSFFPHIHLNVSVYGQAQLYIELPAELTNCYFDLFAVGTNRQSGYPHARYIQQSLYLPAHMHTLQKLAGRCLFFLLFSQFNHWHWDLFLNVSLRVCMHLGQPSPDLLCMIMIQALKKNKTQRWWTHCSMNPGSMQPTWLNQLKCKPQDYMTSLSQVDTMGWMWFCV